MFDAFFGVEHLNFFNGVTVHRVLFAQRYILEKFYQTICRDVRFEFCNDDVHESTPKTSCTSLTRVSPWHLLPCPCLSLHQQPNVLPRSSPSRAISSGLFLTCASYLSQTQSRPQPSSMWNGLCQGDSGNSMNDRP